MPATFKVKKLQEQNLLKYFAFSIFSGFEQYYVFLFYCVTIWLNALNLKVLENNPVYHFKYLTEMRYVAGRNNSIQWFAGWNYSNFMMYHRHTARVMFALVVIHSVTFTYVLDANYAAEAAFPLLYNGCCCNYCCRNYVGSRNALSSKKMIRGVFVIVYHVCYILYGWYLDTCSGIWLRLVGLPRYRCLVL